MKEPKWLFRLESKTPNKGLWYNSYNQYVWNIGDLRDCQTKFLPMDYDPKYHKDDRNWYSSCSNSEDLSHWYSLEDAKELISKGFVFTAYLATEYEEYEKETCFIKDSSLMRIELDIEKIFNGGQIDMCEMISNKDLIAKINANEELERQEEVIRKEAQDKADKIYLETFKKLVISKILNGKNIFYISNKDFVTQNMEESLYTTVTYTHANMISDFLEEQKEFKNIAVDISYCEDTEEEKYSVFVYVKAK